MMDAMKTLIAATLLLLLTGCAGNGHFFPLPTMTQTGVTHAQFARDKLECHTYRFLGVDERAHYRLCMEARGYVEGDREP
jgi:hypothetical protein